MLDEFGLGEMRYLIAKDRHALSPNLPSVVQPSNIFYTPAPASDTNPVTSSTPKIDRIRSVASFSAMKTYTRSLDLLESQSNFHLIFGYTPTIIRLSQQRNNRCATEDTEYFSVKLLTFSTSVSCIFFATPSSNNI